VNERPPLLPPDLLSDRGDPRRATVLFLAALFAIAFWDLGGRSIFHKDLPRFGTIAREMLRSGDWLVPTQYGKTYANKPILYIWAVAGPSALVGDPTVWTIRLPSAIALVWTAWSTYAWTFARTGSRGAGRLAGLLVATTMFVNELGRVGRPDLLSTAFATAAAVWIDRSCLGKGRRLDPLWAGLALGAGLLTKGPVVLLIPLALVFLPRRAVPLRERLRRTRPVLVLAAAVAVGALWLGPAWARGGWEYVRRLVVEQTGERLAGTANHLEAPWYYLWTLFAFSSPWAPVLVPAPLAFLSRRVRDALGDGAHAAAAGVALLVLSIFPTKEIRYASVLIPPMAVALAQIVAWLAARATRAGPWARRLRGFGVVGLLAAAGAGVALAIVPAAIPWALLPALGMAAIGVAALRLRVAEFDAPRLVSRAIGGTVVLVACALLVYWPVFARRFVHTDQQENDAIAGALEPGVPTFLLRPARGGLTPDDLFTGAPNVVYLVDPAMLPPAAAVPRADVVLLEGERAIATSARGQEPVEVLRRRRSDGRTLLVLRFGP
jgi:4-amino-4-deoxy-L-arabinose transferase-like glycosyltransferase